MNRTIRLASLVAASSLVFSGAAATASTMKASEPVSASSTPLVDAETAREDLAPIGAFDVDGLDGDVIQRFGQYVEESAGGEYTIAIPAAERAFDPEGALAAEQSIAEANELMRTAEEHTEDGVVTFGDEDKHVEVKVEWWGLRLMLDPTATQDLIEGLEGAEGAKKIIEDIEALIGMQIPPPFRQIIMTIFDLIAQFAQKVRDCSTDAGVVIKVPWLPLVSCEAPAA